jgi:hypothetical protein
LAVFNGEGKIGADSDCNEMMSFGVGVTVKDFSKVLVHRLSYRRCALFVIVVVVWSCVCALVFVSLFKNLVEILTM